MVLKALSIGALTLLTYSAAHALEGSHSSSTESGFSRAYRSIDHIRVSDFVGRIEIAIGGEETAVLMEQGDNVRQVRFVQNDSMLVVSGERKSRKVDTYKLFKKSSPTADFTDYLRSFPVLRISVPIGSTLEFDNTVSKITAGDTNGHVEIDDGYVEATIGNVKSAYVKVASAGGTSLGNVAEHLKVKVNGSGNFDAMSVGSARLVIGGSGDISIAETRGDATVDIGGSGDVSGGGVGGRLNAKVNGSGSIIFTKVKSGADLSIAGSGDIKLAALYGVARATIAGNGDIAIRDGKTEDLYVSIAGSGEFSHGGVSTNLVASIAGSGSIRVNRNEGTLKTLGNQGVVRVNGEKIYLGRKSR